MVPPATGVGTTPAVDISFPAMGTSCRLVVDGPDRARCAAAAITARQRLDALEDCWTRFRPTSELSRLNAAAGRPTLVGDALLELCMAGRWAQLHSACMVDPLIGAEVIAAGYDRTFSQLETRRGESSGSRSCAPGPMPGPPGERAPDPRPSPDASTALIDVDATTGLVWLPRGRRLDAGGIGKGLAADLLTADLLDAGADWIVVELGGDLRVDGARVARWGAEIDVVDPCRPDERNERLVVHGGGVATSTTARRRWRGPDGRTAHHLIDPRTGRPAVTDLATVTIVAGSALAAEVEAKVVLLAGLEGGLAHMARSGTAGVLVDHQGNRHRVGMAQQGQT